MTNLVPPLKTRRRAVRLWLLAVAALIFATVIVGGATRLTESGLSIVEWKPVTGVIPPFDVRFSLVSLARPDRPVAARTLHHFQGHDLLRSNAHRSRSGRHLPQ
jgi:Cytochrome oxidase assembly protein